MSTVTVATRRADVVRVQSGVRNVVNVRQSAEVSVVTLTRSGPQGPKGDSAGVAVSKSLYWLDGHLSEIRFADGSVKSFTWADGRPVQIDHFRPSLGTTRTTIGYSPDGLIDSVIVSSLP